MDRNVLIIGFPHYAVINFYKELFLLNYKKINFYIITEIGDGKYQKIFDGLKSKKIIREYFFTEIDQLDNFKLSKSIMSFKNIKKISKELCNIKFEKIICSDFSHIEVQYLIKNLKKNNPKIVIVGFNFHSFKISEKIINFNTFSFRNYLGPRTLLRKFKFYLSHFIKNIILSLIFFQKTNKNFFLQTSYKLFYNQIDYIISDKPFEIYHYKKKFDDIKIYFLNYENVQSTDVKGKKNLLVLLELIKNPKSNSFLIQEYEKYIKLLIEKLSINHVCLKPHPRDLTDNCLMLKNILTNCSCEIIPKDLDASKIVCEYEYILGAGSSVMSDAINYCNYAKVFGMLKLGNQICKDPSVKVLLGDSNEFKSGIIWIEDHNNLYKMSPDEINELASSQKQKRTLSAEEQILFEDFFKH